MCEDLPPVLNQGVNDDFLDEWQVVFDPSVVAFPSIFGYHAVALLTKQGVYGVRNFGGAETEKHKDRSDGFATFVKAHNPLRGG